MLFVSCCMSFLVVGVVWVVSLVFFSVTVYVVGEYWQWECNVCCFS